jgi:hypothetical protein
MEIIPFHLEKPTPASPGYTNQNPCQCQSRAIAATTALNAGGTEINKVPRNPLLVEGGWREKNMYVCMQQIATQRTHKAGGETEPAGYQTRNIDTQKGYQGYRRHLKTSDGCEPDQNLMVGLCFESARISTGRRGRELRTGRAYSSDWRSSEPASDLASPPLWTFLCRRRLETTEKLRPQPSTSQANAERS